MIRKNTNNVLFNLGASFIGIDDKEDMARDEIRAAAERLTDCGFTDSQIHQYDADLWDSDDAATDQHDAKIWRCDYFEFMGGSGSLSLELSRKGLLSLPVSLSEEKELECCGVIESIALMKLISNDMSQTRFELVQCGLQSIEDEVAHCVQKAHTRRIAKKPRPGGRKLPPRAKLLAEFNDVANGPAGERGAAGIIAKRYGVTARAVNKARNNQKTGT